MGIINREGALFLATGIDNSGMRKDAAEAEQIIDGIGDHAKKAGMIIGGMFAISGAKDFISQIIRVRGEFQLMDSAIQTLVGDKTKADDLLVKVKQYASASPLEFKDISKATQMLLSFNIEAERIPRYLEAIGDVSMGETAKFNSLTLAFSQMSSTGKLMGQDLNQMINAGFNPLQMMSEKTGKSISRLKDEMSAGAISAEMVQQAFIDATSEGGKFYKMSENAAKTIPGQISAMNDAWDTMLNNIGTKSEGVIGDSIQSVTLLIENYEKVGKVLIGLVATYGAYRVALYLALQAEKGYNLASILTYNRLLLVEKAQKLLNATMLKNPYVLATVALGALVTAMWASYDASTAAEKAQKRYGEILERNAEKKNKFKSRTEELISILKDETATINQQIKAYKELQSLNPKFKGMSMDEIKSLSQEDLQIMVNLSIDDKELQLAKSEIEKAEKNLNEKLKQYEWDKGSPNATFSKKRYEEAEKYLSIVKKGYQDIIDLRKEAEFEAKPKEERLRILQAEKDALKAQRQAIIDTNPEIEKVIDGTTDIKDNALNLNSAWGKFDLQTATNLSHVISFGKQIDKITAKISGITGDEKSEVRNKSYWEKIKKDAEDARDALDISKVNTGEWEELTKTIANAQKEIDKYSIFATSKLGDQAQKLREQQEKYRVLLDKQGLEQIRAEEDLQTQVDQARIDAMDEGSAKYIAKRELNFEKELQAIDRQKEDMLRKKIEDKRAAFEANPENKGKAFDVTDIVLSGKEMQHFDALYTAELKSQSKERKSVLETELSDMRKYLEEYGTFEQKKLSIAQEYEEKIKKTQNQWEAKSLAKERDTKITDIEVSAIKMDVDWATVFGSFGGMFKDVIKDSLEKAEQYTKTEKFKNSDQASQSAVIEAINQMKKTVGGTGTLDFKKIGQDMQAYQASLRELDYAKNEEIDAINKLKKATKDYEDAIKNGTETEKEAARSAVETAQQNADTASGAVKSQTDIVDQNKRNLSETASALDISMKNVTEGLSKLSAGGLRNAYDGIIQAGKGMGGAIEKVSDSLESVPIIGWILSIIDVLKDGLSNLVGSLLDAIFNAVEGIIHDVLSGDLFVTIGKSIKDGIGKIFNAISFGGWNSLMNTGSNAKETAEKIEKLTASNDALKTSIDGLKKEIEGANGAKSVKAYGEAVDAQKRYEDNLRQILDAQMRYSSAHHSNAYYWNLERSSLSQINKLLGTSLNNTWSDFSKLTSDQMNQIRTHLPDIWSEMINEGKYGDRFKEDWSNYADQAGQLEELTNNLRESLAQISFDSLRDSFVDALMNMDADARSFADDFEEYMTRALLNFAVGDKLDQNLREWYNSWADTMKTQNGKLTEDQINAYRSQWEAFVQEGLDIRDELAALTGYTGKSSSSQDSTKRGFETMTQDQASELGGRFTAFQASNEEIKQLASIMQLDVSEIRRIGMLANEILLDLREIGLDTVFYLEKISKDTPQLYIISKRLEEIEKNTREL